METFGCSLCGESFSYKKTLAKHLKEKKCKGEMLNDLIKLDTYIKTLLKRCEGMVIVGDHNNQDKSMHIKIEINVNPITKLEIKHIDHLVMRNLIEKYDGDNDKLNSLLSDYVKNMICDASHPENNSIKYVTKRPPTFNSTIEDDDGKITTTIKGLKDTCEILSDPMLNTLNSKLKECLKAAKRDEDFDYDMYEKGIKAIKVELNKDNVKKALKRKLCSFANGSVNKCHG